MVKRRPKRKLQTLNTLAQLKALADPLRYRIFEHLVGEPRTAKQMAELLGTHPTRLYHHFRVLENAGLIRLARTRKKRGTVEKYFEAVAERIVLGPDILRDKPLLGCSLYAGVLQATLADLEAAARKKRGGSRGPRVLLKRLRIRTTRAKARELKRKLEAWIAACQDASSEKGEAEFRVTLAFYEAATTSSKEEKS